MGRFLYLCICVNVYEEECLLSILHSTLCWTLLCSFNEVDVLNELVVFPACKQSSPNLYPVVAAGW